LKIDHIGLWTADLERLKDFYQKYFKTRSGEKYHNPNKDFKSYFLIFSDGSRLEIMTKPGLLKAGPKDECLGYVHLAIKLGSKSAVDQLTDLLKRDGVEIFSEPRTTGDGYYESVIIDPDGNLVELVA